jgi:hypothetical protein
MVQEPENQRVKVTEMNDYKEYFQKASYLQYPLMLSAVGYFYKPFFTGFDSMWNDYNYGLIFMGLGFSFATLQDTTKTQNEFSKKIYKNPVWSRRFLIYIMVLVIVFIVGGLYALFASETEIINSLSYGLLSVGVGLLGVLKSAGEMAQYHSESIN